MSFTTTTSTAGKIIGESERYRVQATKVDDAVQFSVSHKGRDQIVLEDEFYLGVGQEFDLAVKENSSDLDGDILSIQCGYMSLCFHEDSMSIDVTTYDVSGEPAGEYGYANHSDYDAPKLFKEDTETYGDWIRKNPRCR